jgi:hypothetical protein
MEMQRGRPKVDKKAAFRNVAVPLEIYDMIRELSKTEDSKPDSSADS